MKKTLCLIIASFLLTRCDRSADLITFYHVPLICGAAPQIGCGSRIKPLFVDLEKMKSVSEAWTNRAGTIIAIKWSREASSKEIDAQFEKHDIKADAITDRKIIDSLSTSMTSDSGWLKGMAVDTLSLYEAGVISRTYVDFALEANLINKEEHEAIRKDVEAYFKKELVKVRTAKELNSEECRDNWRQNGYLIYKSHVGEARAQKVAEYFSKLEIEMQESCCSEEEECSEAGLNSTITCPHCGHKKTETMPTDVCLGKYTCEDCKKIMVTKSGDCCVFCSYGDHKCPSKQ